jgi:hypothetical protein
MSEQDLEIERQKAEFSEKLAKEIGNDKDKQKEIKQLFKRIEEAIPELAVDFNFLYEIALDTKIIPANDIYVKIKNMYISTGKSIPKMKMLYKKHIEALQVAKGDPYKIFILGMKAPLGKAKFGTIYAFIEESGLVSISVAVDLWDQVASMSKKKGYSINLTETNDRFYVGVIPNVKEIDFSVPMDTIVEDIVSNYTMYRPSRLTTKDDYDPEKFIGPGDDTFFIGYLNKTGSSKRVTPIMMEDENGETIDDLPPDVPVYFSLSAEGVELGDFEKVLAFGQMSYNDGKSNPKYNKENWNMFINVVLRLSANDDMAGKEEDFGDDDGFN